MNLKHSLASAQLNSTPITTTTEKVTKKSFLNEPPKIANMEIHPIPSIAGESSKKLLKATKNYHSSNKSSKKLQAEQQLHQREQLEHFEQNPPQIATQQISATVVTATRNIDDKTFKIAATSMLQLTPRPAESSLQVSCLTATYKENMQQQQQEQQRQQQQQQILSNIFPVDSSDEATTATTTRSLEKIKLVSSKMVAETSAKILARDAATTTTTTAVATTTVLKQLYNSSCGYNNSDIIASDASKIATTRIRNSNFSDRKSKKSHLCGNSNSCLNSNDNNINGNSRSSVVNNCDIILQLPRRTMLQALQQQQLQLQQKVFYISSAARRIVLLLLTLTAITQCWAGRQDALSNCTFPARWEGSWFLSGYQQSIHIKGSQFSYRGKCAASDGNKYLIVDEKGCHRCLVIYEKHKNVLQYKESECEGDSMYLHQTNPSAMAMRSALKQNGDHTRAGAHPNSNGHSRLSSSDQYIMRSNDDMNDCPSDFCKGRETLQNLCDQIPGDALLYSLFRESAEPVKCPLKGPFVFTYNRGHGECKSPVSNIDSCTEDSRLLLSFQACPDVQGTESTVEELTCLATWKDGNSRYLVGLVSHHHAISNEERYRCFVYEKISSLMGGPGITSSKDAEYKLAQSGDATCNGLDSAEVGSRIMSLRKPPPAERCDFPAWFKGPRHWHALMGNAVYNYHSNDGSMHIIKPNGYMETRALCEQINKQTATEMMAVVHYTTGCQSGFMCMMFYRRDTHVIEIQTGKQASRLEDACAPDHFDINRMPYITLLANNPDPQICPLEGLYNLRGAIGPPHISARHKRNHNNKGHAGHGHHRLQHDFNAGGGGMSVGLGVGGSGASVGAAESIDSSGNAFGHKRRNAMSFRNSEQAEHNTGHSHAGGVAIRSRREALPTTTTATATPPTSAMSSFNAAAAAELEPDNTMKIKSVRKTAVGTKFAAMDLNHDDDDGDDSNNKNGITNNVANSGDAFALRDLKTTSKRNADDDYRLKSRSDKKCNSNDNNINNISSRSHKNGKKLRHEQLKTAAAATSTEKEKIAAKLKALQATEELQQQLQHKLSAMSSAAAAAAATKVATAARAEEVTTDLEVASGMMKPATDALITFDAEAVGDGVAVSTAAAADNHAIATTHSNRATFIASATQQRSRRDAPGCVANYKAQRQLWIGCTAPNLIDVRPQCSDDGDEEYSCHGSWADNGTVFIIARHKGSKHGVCISYRPMEGLAAQLVVGDACYRGSGPPTEHPLVANLTVFGKCGDTSSTSPLLPRVASTIWWTIPGTLLTYLLSQYSAR